MRHQLLYAIMFSCITFSGFTQNDSIPKLKEQKINFYKKQIIPTGLIVTGSLLNIGTIKNKIHDVIPKTNNDIDDYIQYAPMVEVYLFDALGFKHQNSVFDQTKYLAISQLIFKHFDRSSEKNRLMLLVPPVQIIPSHRAIQLLLLLGLTALFHEFKDSEPLIAYSGFVFATATGVLRMTNNAHWLPDVMVGAGIGILTTNIVYYLKPFQGFQPFKKKKEIAVTPVITGNSLGFLCRF